MPTHEDIFLLNLLLDEEWVSSKDTHLLLCSIYKEESYGKTVSLAQAVSDFVPRQTLEQALGRVRKTLEEIRPSGVFAQKTIDFQACKRESILGKSSLGTTYKGSHPEIGECAIKCLDGIIAQNKKFLRRFLLQMKKVERLRHPNLSKIYAIDAQRGVLVRELVVGENLEDALIKGPLPLSKASFIVSEVAQGLEVLSNFGLLHKNLKPGNIILSQEGAVKLVDGCLPPTTPHYLSPEQCQKQKSDIRSDIYSLGIIYYQMLTGSLPYEGSNARYIMEQHVRGDFIPLEEKNRAIPESVCSIVSRMMEKDPDRRYRNVPELLQEMEKFVGPKTTGSKETPIFSGHPDAPSIDHGDLEEDAMMHTAIMAAVAPSVDVIKHRKAKKIACEIVEDMALSFSNEIKEACKKNRFYEDLANVIETARRKFQARMLPTSVEGMNYLEEALEQLKKKTMREMPQEEAKPQQDVQPIKPDRLKPAFPQEPRIEIVAPVAPMAQAQISAPVAPKTSEGIFEEVVPKVSRLKPAFPREPRTETVAQAQISEPVEPKPSVEAPQEVAPKVSRLKPAFPKEPEIKSEATGSALETFSNTSVPKQERLKPFRFKGAQETEPEGKSLKHPTRGNEIEIKSAESIFSRLARLSGDESDVAEAQLAEEDADVEAHEGEEPAMEAQIAEEDAGVESHEEEEPAVEAQIAEEDADVEAHEEEEPAMEAQIAQDENAVEVHEEPAMEAQIAQDENVVEAHEEEEPAMEAQIAQDENVVESHEEEEPAMEAQIAQDENVVEAHEEEEPAMEAQIAQDETSECQTARNEVLESPAAEGAPEPHSEEVVMEAQFADETHFTNACQDEFEEIEDRVSEAAMEAVADEEQIQDVNQTPWLEEMEAEAVEDSELQGIPSLPEKNNFHTPFGPAAISLKPAIPEEGGAADVENKTSDSTVEAKKTKPPLKPYFLKMKQEEGPSTEE